MTGGNSGTGYETSKALFEAGATVYLACRNLEKGRKAIEDIKKGGTYGFTGMEYPKNGSTVRSTQNGGRLELIQLDLTDFESISEFVDEFKR